MRCRVGGVDPPPPRAPCALPGILHPGVVLLAVGGAGLGCGGSGYCCVGGCGGHPGLCKLPGGGSNTPSMAEHPRDVPEGGTPILARLTGLTSCPLQHPQGAVLEGCDPRGKAAWGPRAVFRGGACVPGPPPPSPQCSGVPPVSPVRFRLGGTLAQLCLLLGCSQGHCRVTQRAYPTRLSLPAPAETWHTRCRPADSRGRAHQPARQCSHQGCCHPWPLPAGSAVCLPALAGAGHS